MKYSILGFSQKAVIALQRREEIDGKEVIFKLDVDDLLILNVIAEMHARKSIKKVIIEDKTFCWINYHMILSDLPILDICKRRLVQRLDKMEKLGLIEKIVEKEKGVGTFTYIRMADGYEDLKYSKDSEKSADGNKIPTDGNFFPGGRNKIATKDLKTILNNNTYKEGNISYEISPQKGRGNENEFSENPLPCGAEDISGKTSDDPERKVAQKEKPPKEPWRESFDEYMKLVNEGAAALMADAKFRAEVEQLQPNVDYDRTIKWCVSQYWGTEQAWERKRRSRTKTINMKATLRQNFDKNRIYKERQASYSGGFRPRDVDTHNVNDQWGDIVAEQMRRVEEEKRRNGQW